MQNKISDFIYARIMSPRAENHFEKTKNGKILSRLKNQYSGKRCFLIGNGPSLQAEDLTRLHENGEITFAFNRIYTIFDSTPWRPTFYISQDEKMLGGCQKIVDKLALPVKFIPIQLHWYHDIRIHKAAWFYLKAPAMEGDKPLDFSDDISSVIFNSGTCMYTAAQIAAYMGFTEIYFIGVDHHFHISQNNNGEIIVDDSAKDYFSDKYNEDKANLYIPNTEKSTLTYVALKEQCDKRSINVFNATRGGKLEIFPRVDFDTLFEDDTWKRKKVN